MSHMAYTRCGNWLRRRLGADGSARTVCRVEPVAAGTGVLLVDLRRTALMTVSIARMCVRGADCASVGARQHLPPDEGDRPCHWQLCATVNQHGSGHQTQAATRQARCRYGCCGMAACCQQVTRATIAGGDKLVPVSVSLRCSPLPEVRRAIARAMPIPLLTRGAVDPPAFSVLQQCPRVPNDPSPPTVTALSVRAVKARKRCWPVPSMLAATSAGIRSCDQAAFNHGQCYNHRSEWRWRCRCVRSWSWSWSWSWSQCGCRLQRTPDFCVKLCISPAWSYCIPSELVLQGVCATLQHRGGDRPGRYQRTVCACVGALGVVAPGVGVRRWWLVTRHALAFPGSPRGPRSVERPGPG